MGNVLHHMQGSMHISLTKRQLWGHLANLSEFNRNGKKDRFSQPLWLIWIVLKEIIISTCDTVFLYFIYAWNSKIMIH